MTIIVENGKLPEEEIKEYERFVKEKYKDEDISLLRIKIDGDHVELETHKTTAGFQRVRRVTGYLNVVERFNNAKQSEVQDRVPHGYEDYTHTVSGLLDD